MTDLDHCLLGCDKALAEADSLLVTLSGEPASLDSEITAVRRRIAILRHEVERLRGLAPRVRRNIHPDWINLSNGSSPWPVPSRDFAEEA